MPDTPQPRAQLHYPLGPCGEGGIRDARGNLLATMYFSRDDRIELRDLFIACVNAMHEAGVTPEELPLLCKLRDAEIAVLDSTGDFTYHTARLRVHRILQELKLRSTVEPPA